MTTEIPKMQLSCLANHDHSEPPCVHAEFKNKDGVEWIENGRVIIRPLTAEEIAQREAAAAAFAAERAAREVEAAEKQAQKEAIANRLGLTIEELAILLS